MGVGVVNCMRSSACKSLAGRPKPVKSCVIVVQSYVLRVGGSLKINAGARALRRALAGVHLTQTLHIQGNPQTGKINRDALVSSQLLFVIPAPPLSPIKPGHRHAPQKQSAGKTPRLSGAPFCCVVKSSHGVSQDVRDRLSIRFKYAAFLC